MTPLDEPLSLAFVGRTDERVQIHQHLARPDCRLITITGFGGVGKTRLALEALYDWQNTHPTALAVFISLESGYFPLNLAHALDLVVDDPADCADQIASFLTDRAALIVLDYPSGDSRISQNHLTL